MTASQVGSIVKMRKTTKRSNKVKALLYSNFRGNEATRYGLAKEEESKQRYMICQQQNGHSNLTIYNCGLFVSSINPWLAASPDGCLLDSSNPSQIVGLVEIKNAFSMKDKSIPEAFTTSSTFCLERKNEKYHLKPRHDYFYQVQCQLYCADCEWCDFVLTTDKDMHIERIYRDITWWDLQLKKLKTFYFEALLPELASPRHRNGGIREPATSEDTIPNK